MTKYFTARELAEMFKVHVKTVYVWIYEGKLEATKLGRTVRFSEKQLEAFMKPKRGRTKK